MEAVQILEKLFNVAMQLERSEEILVYLSGLNGEKQQRAEEYIRRAPPQIRTPYRRAIKREFGWTGAEVDGIA